RRDGEVEGAVIISARPGSNPGRVFKKGSMYRYAKRSTIDTPAQGVLNAAIESKKKWFKQVKRLRDCIREHSLSNSRYRLDLLRAEERWHEAQNCERAALREIERRANELGLTTIRPKKGNDSNDEQRDSNH